MKNGGFFDKTSKTAYNEFVKTNSSVCSRVMLNIERFEIASRYVTAKVQNRYGDDVTINIQGGRLGIEIQDSLFKIKEEKRENPSYAYLITSLIQNAKILARKLPIVGRRDWLLIYEDTLLELSVKDAYDELSLINCRRDDYDYNNFGSLFLMLSINFSKYGIIFILVFV